VGFTLTVTFAVLNFVASDLRLSFTSKVNVVSTVTLGATKVAVGDAADWMLIDGEAGDVLVQANTRLVDGMPGAVLEDDLGTHALDG
jgi:hypothetical protein